MIRFHNSKIYNESGFESQRAKNSVWLINAHLVI